MWELALQKSRLQNDQYSFHFQAYWGRLSLPVDVSRSVCSRLRLSVVKTASTSTSGFLMDDMVAFLVLHFINIRKSLLVRPTNHFLFSSSVVKPPSDDLVLWGRLHGRGLNGAKFPKQLSVQRPGNCRQGHCYRGVGGIPCGNAGLPQHRRLELTWWVQLTGMDQNKTKSFGLF